MVLFDTNILLRYLLDDNAEMAGKADEEIAGCFLIKKEGKLYQVDGWTI